MLTAVHVGLTTLNVVLLGAMVINHRQVSACLQDLEMATRAGRVGSRRVSGWSSSGQLDTPNTAIPFQMDAIAIVEVLPRSPEGRRQRVRLDSAGLIHELRDVESAMRREGMLPPARFVAGLNDEGRLFLQEEALVSGLRREPLDEG